MERSITKVEEHINQRLGELSSLTISTESQNTSLLLDLQSRILNLESSASSQTNDHWATVMRRTITHLRVPSSLCRPRCPCQCHLTRAYGSWQFSGLQQVLGAIKITFVGIKRGTSPEYPCTETSCQDRRRHSAVLVQYCLPNWLANALFSVFFSYHGSPELLIRVYRVVSPDDWAYSVFNKIECRDTNGVKAAILARPSSVHDMTVDHQSPLLYAILSRSDTEIIRVLLQAGANPFQESASGSTVAQQAVWSCIQARSGSTRAREIAEMMPMSTVFEEGGFTELHRFLMGLLPTRLPGALRNPLFQAQVNSETTRGLAPLHMAAQGGNVTKCQLLLAAGVDVDTVTKSGATPLVLACREGHQDTALLLLAAGVAAAGPSASRYTPQLRYHLGFRPLHSATFNGSTDLILNLLSHGADIHARARYGHTPLAVAAYCQNIPSLRTLIQCGADLDASDLDGDPPLHAAIGKAANGAAEILLNSGADYRLINVHGRGLLHEIATYGDGATMRLFTGKRLAGLPDPYSYRDRQGKTAIDRLRDRSDFADDLGAAFHVLLGSIAAARLSAEGGDDDDEIEEFYDALESQSTRLNSGANQ